MGSRWSREKFIREALTAWIKMTTEAVNVRGYIDAKFQQVPNPAIFVMGDLNDGPGKGSDISVSCYMFAPIL